jgi:hypothetical protein
MIITKLIGGLGNQMFQYAAGRQTAITNNTELKLDISGYDHQIGITPRKYMLDVFNIHASVATKQEIKLFNNHSKYRIQRNLHRIMLSLLRRHYIRQKTSGFAHEFLTISDESYLDGYWGSEKYFKDIKNIIHKEFTFKNKPDVANRKMISRIKNCDSVSIHIRHGDYIEDKKTNQFHGVCDLGYYFKAVTLIVKKVKSPQFFVFSDDLLWAKQNFHLKFPCIYVDHNIGKKDYEDMRLISYCQHNIIANSSFSWWGAWLNKNPDKIVIAPREWFCDKSIDTKDLIPQSWIKK